MSQYCHMIAAAVPGPSVPLLNRKYGGFDLVLRGDQQDTDLASSGSRIPLIAHKGSSL